MRLHVVVIAALFISSCASMPEPPPPPPPPAPVEASPPPPPPPPPAPAAPPEAPPAAPVVGFGDVSLTATREYLTADASLKPVFATRKPLAFIILDNNDPKRNMKICSAFEDLPTSAFVQDIAPSANPVPTFWLLKSKEVPEEGAADRCKKLVANFDFKRANQLASTFKLPKVSSAYLMAVDGSGKTFFVNINNGSQEQLNGLMRVWFATAAGNPDKNGIQLQEWWRSVAKEVCGEDFIKVAAQAILPGWAGSLMGILVKSSGECKLEKPKGKPPAPADVIASIS